MRTVANRTVSGNLPSGPGISILASKWLTPSKASVPYLENESESHDWLLLLLP